MNSKFTRNLLLMLICLFLLIPSVSAHGMFLKLIEPGVLQAEYDGGGFSPRTEVIIYDQNDQELGKGPVDEKGQFHFDPELKVKKAVADDGMGHRAEYKEGVETKSIPKAPVVIAVFIVIGLISFYFNKKSKAKNKAL